jgi:hypothetical protein
MDAVNERTLRPSMSSSEAISALQRKTCGPNGQIAAASTPNFSPRRALKTSR